MFNGDDTSINLMPFGDGVLDVSDVYVTFRRSLDPSLTWYRRFWTNGVLAAEPTVNGTTASVSQPAAQPKAPESASSGSSASQAQVNFSAGDALVSAGQTLQIPITAQVFGAYPLRILMLNLDVQPLDGSPALATPVQFTPNPVLGAPAISSSTDNGNYAAAWLNSQISGLTSNAVIGTLTVTIPTNATSASAYDVVFTHASGSPNGVVSFPRHIHTGLITLADRSTSYYGDRIPDSWRLRYFGTIYNLLSQEHADADGDGVNNWSEYIAGTDPTDPTSYLKMSGSTDPATQNHVIQWPSVLGKTYLIQSSTRLFGGSWSNISTNVGTGGTMQFTDPQTGGALFYRVQVQQ
jgi:hypothetical protein